ncbi:ParB/RepB/Spo0J family partition protein [Candidatus Uhrbacteria bacterium]|nr:ParB/RepB/Spo0J family partition protein [Candidatus Uhrbacteria bacterium]
MQKTSLGRGLDALLSRKNANAAPSQTRPPSSDEAIVELPIEVIQTNEYQPRHEFNEEQLSELAHSIREYGVIQPLVVSRSKDGYQLIAGERRLRASKMAGLKKVPVVLREAGDHERLAVALIENVQRVDLNPIELGIAFKRLHEEFNLSHDEIGRRVGKSRPVISNMIRLLNLPAVIQDALREGMIHFSVARAILGLPGEDKQLEFFYQVLEGNVKKDDIEHQVTVARGASGRKRRGDPHHLAQEDALRQKLGTKVKIKRNGAGGSIVIYYYSPEELEELINAILE